MGLFRKMAEVGAVKKTAAYFGPQIVVAQSFFASREDFVDTICSPLFLGLVTGCTRYLAHASGNGRPEKVDEMVVAVYDRIFGHNFVGRDLAGRAARESIEYLRRPKTADQDLFDAGLLERVMNLGS